MRLLSIILLCALLGCYSPKKADKQLGRALYYYPERMAKIARNAFPCSTLSVITTYEDSIIYVNCDTIILSDTIIRKVPVKIKNKTVVNHFEDSAKIKVLLFDKLTLQNDKNSLTEKLKKKNTFIKYLLILLSVFLVPVIIKLIRK
jgi:hypothetical protein